MSTNVVFPWSTWAMIATFRRSRRAEVEGGCTAEARCVTRRTHRSNHACHPTGAEPLPDDPVVGDGTRDWRVCCRASGANDAPAKARCYARRAMGADRVGKTLAGRYQLVEVVGEGGMAIVWRALTLGAAGFKRPVAVKRIRTVLARDPAFVSM